MADRYLVHLINSDVERSRASKAKWPLPVVIRLRVVTKDLEGVFVGITLQVLIQATVGLGLGRYASAVI